MDQIIECQHALEVCNALSYINARDAISKHVDGDDVAKRDAIDSFPWSHPTH